MEYIKGRKQIKTKGCRKKDNRYEEEVGETEAQKRERKKIRKIKEEICVRDF